MTKDSLLTIKEFATLCRTTVRTIRFYDQENLIEPTKVDPFTGYRYYSSLQVRDYFRIKLFHTFNLPLAQIGKSLRSKNKQKLLDNRLETLDEQIRERQKEYEFLKTIREFLYEKGNPEAFLKQTSIGSYLLFCKLIEQGRYDSINQEIFELIALAKKLNISTTTSQMLFYLDPVAFKPKNTRLELGLICKGLKGPRDINLPPNHYFKTYPKTKIRFFDYEGPFEYITLIYQRFHQNRQNRTLKPKEAGFDIYLKGPWNEKSEYKFLTKICFPI